MRVPNQSESCNPVLQGKLFVITGPSGVGKGTVCQRLLREIEGLTLSISATSRPKRLHEEDGRDYFFKTPAEFEQMIEEDLLLEWAQYNGNYYGTPRKAVEQCLQLGQDILLEIDTQGALMIKEKFGAHACLIFVAPPSMQELEARLRGRGTDGDTVIRSRLEIAKHELMLKEQFDFVVVNQDLEICLGRIRNILAGFCD